MDGVAFARSRGSPSRRRAILLGPRRGIPLPAFVVCGPIDTDHNSALSGAGHRHARGLEAGRADARVVDVDARRRRTLMTNRPTVLVTGARGLLGATVMRVLPEA